MPQFEIPQVCSTMLTQGRRKKSGTKGKKTSLDKEIYDRGTEKIGTYTCNKVT